VASKPSAVSTITEGSLDVKPLDDAANVGIAARTGLLANPNQTEYSRSSF